MHVNETDEDYHSFFQKQKIKNMYQTDASNFLTVSKAAGEPPIVLYFRAVIQ